MGAWQGSWPPPSSNRVTPNGWVYVVRCGDTDLYKVGATKQDPAERVRGIQCHCPYPLRLIDAVRTRETGLTEPALMLELGALGRHVRGEWFRLTEREAQTVLRRQVAWVGRPRPDPWWQPLLDRRWLSRCTFPPLPCCPLSPKVP